MCRKELNDLISMKETFTMRYYQFNNNMLTDNLSNIFLYFI